jgi:predicted secreted protein
MRTRTGLTATTLAAAALLGACGTAGSQPGQDQPGAGGCRSGPVQVTEADNGKTLCVTTGSAVTLMLRAPAKGMRWSAARSDSDVLVPLGSSGGVGPADVTSAAYTAGHPGTARISASRPACDGNGQVSCHAVLGFQVTVTVK